MKFRLLLWLMAQRMAVLVRTHSEFATKLEGRDFVLQISAADGVHRYFHLRPHQVSSQAGRHCAPDLHLHFRHSQTGFDLLLASDANRFMQAMQQGEVSVTGDFALLMWLLGVSSYLKPAIVSSLTRTAAFGYKFLKIRRAA